MVRLRRMLQLILKFLQAVIGELHEQLDSLVWRFRVAYLVRFERRQVILLRRLRPRDADCQSSRKTTSQNHSRPGSLPGLHGCFSGEFSLVGLDAGAFAGGCSPGLRGNSSFSSSISISSKSFSTICIGGRYASGIAKITSRTSR